MADVVSISTLVMVGLLGVERIMNRLGFKHCHSECCGGSSLDISNSENNSGSAQKIEDAVNTSLTKMRAYAASIETPTKL